MTKQECIDLYMDLVEVGRKIMKIETKLSRVLRGEIHAFDSSYDKLASIIFDAIAKLKFNINDIPSEDYKAFLTSRIDQHMADYLELIQEEPSIQEEEGWIEENINFMLTD